MQIDPIYILTASCDQFNSQREPTSVSNKILFGGALFGIIFAFMTAYNGFPRISNAVQESSMILG